MKSVSTLFALDAQTSLPTGRPICFAYQPARMSPKLPVGTTKLSSSPIAIMPPLTVSQYAEK